MNWHCGFGGEHNPSNFWHDSHEYVAPRKEYNFNYSYRSTFSINTDFKPLANAMKYNAKANFWTSALNGIFNLGAAALLSRGSEGGSGLLASIGTNTIGSLLGGGGGYSGGSWGVSPGSLSSAPYTSFAPWQFTPGAGGNNSNPVGNNNGNNGNNGNVGNTGNNGNNGNVGNTGNNGGSNPNPVDNNNGNNGNVGNTGNNGNNGNGTTISAADFNSMIDDTYDADADGKKNTLGSDGKLTGTIDKGDLIYGRLGGANGRHDTQSAHDTSDASYTEEAHHAGLSRGPAKAVDGVKADDKTSEGYYKYITLTATTWQKDNLAHLQSGSKLSLKFVSAGPEGITYQLDPDSSDFKTDNGIEYINDLKAKITANPTDYQYTITYNKSGKYLDFGQGKQTLAHVAN